MEKIPYLPIDQFEGELDKDFIEIANTGNGNCLPWAQLPKNNTEVGRNVFSYEVALQLSGMGMEKYIEAFKAFNITWEILWLLTEQDLLLIGVDDLQDRETIMKSLQLSSSLVASDITVPSSAKDDLIIAKNLLNQTLLIDGQIKYLIWKADKCDLKDWFVNDYTKASDLAKLIVNKSVQQTDLICNTIGHPTGSTGVIWTILKKKDWKLSKSELQKWGKGSKLKKKRLALVVLSAVGVCCVAILVADMLRQGKTS